MSRFFHHYRRSVFKEDSQFSYAWDDWKSIDYFYFNTPEVSQRFSEISFLGCRGFTIAAAELVAIRVAPGIRVDHAISYLDAAWVSMLEDGICDYAVLTRGDWPGPFLGPLRAAMLIVNDTLFDAVVDGDIRARCSFIHNLLVHILQPDHLPAYRDWLDACLVRLRSDHPEIPISVDIFADVMPLGAPTSPETFIVDQPYQPGRCEADLIVHRNRLSDGNPWLRVEPLHGIVG